LRAHGNGEPEQRGDCECNSLHVVFLRRGLLRGFARAAHVRGLVGLIVRLMIIRETAK
jgi:hypothetical protein